MNPHDTIRDLLALSAAGMLEAADERRVREHIRECVECAGLVEELGTLADDLRGMAVPAASPDLALRTRGLIAAELAAQADRRQGAWLAGFAGVFGWGMALTTAYVFQLAGGGSLWIWLACHSVVALLGAPAGAALYRQGRKSERSAS